MLRNLFYAIISIVAFTLVCAFAASKSGKYKYIGQAAPPDMEFIPGNDSMPSFFISKSQETNLNYVTYLDWLQRVYVDYPEVAKTAIPHDVEQGILYTYNDPILRGQLRNPAFAYYPVTGVDWLQIQDYLAWKTDRLNESIMIKEQFYKWNPDQTNEDNFNLESYLVGQYEGKIKLERRDESVRGGYRKLRIDDGIFLFGYRLPTEAEWEYAASPQFSNNHLSKGEKYPYGKKYFTFYYTYNYGYKLAGKNESEDLNRIKGGSTYNNHFYGIYNMGDNVKEWLLDEYSPEKKQYKSIEEIYTRNGFYFPKADEKDVKKDSKGHLPYRIMNMKNNGDELRIVRYKYVEDYYIFSSNPDSLIVRKMQSQFLRRAVGDYSKNEDFAVSNNYLKELKHKYERYPNQYDSRDWYEKGYEKTRQIGRDTFQRYLDTTANIISPEYIEERLFLKTRKERPYYPNDTITKNRVIKSGTWRNPSKTARESMKETDASADVGFRTVIPYMAMPTKYKVKWK